MTADEAKILALRIASGGPIRPRFTGAIQAPKSKRPKAPKVAGPNKTEQRFWDAMSLRLLQVAYEPITLKLGADCRYTPDFGYPVEGPTRFYEVKGTSKKTGKPRVEDDALVKIKVAAKMFPAYKFIMVWEVNGEWQEKEIPRW